MIKILFDCEFFSSEKNTELYHLRENKTKIGFVKKIGKRVVDIELLLYEQFYDQYEKGGKVSEGNKKNDRPESS